MFPGLETTRSGFISTALLKARSVPPGFPFSAVDSAFGTFGTFSASIVTGDLVAIEHFCSLVSRIRGSDLVQEAFRVGDTGRFRWFRRI